MKLLTCALFAALACTSTVAYSQIEADLQTGLNPFDSYHSGNIDSVSLSNGNVTVKIPLASYPQRGGKLTQNYELIYNGKPWSEVKFCFTLPVPPHTTTCRYVWENKESTTSGAPGFPMGQGWTFIDDQDVGTNNSDVTLPAGAGGDTITYEYENFLTSDGSSHPAIPIDDSHQRSLDGSGFIVGAAWEVNGTLGEYTPCTANCALRDSKGIAYWPNGAIAGEPNIVREDANGNQLVATLDAEGNSTSLTDTVGRTIPAMTTTTDFSGCPSSPLATTSAYLWQPPGYNGGTLTYKFCMATVAVNIPAGVYVSSAEGVTANLSYLQAIILPNTQTWVFQYSSRNPGDDPSINYGDLTETTFPTGATISYSYATETLPGTGPVGAQSATSMWATSRIENANDGNGNLPWTYTWGLSASTSSTSITNTVTDPAGNDTTHTFTTPYIPIETNITSYQGPESGGQILKQVTTINGQWPGVQYNGGNLSGYFPVGIWTTLGSQTSHKELVYGAGFTDYTDAGAGNFGLVTQASMYDYGGALLRQDQTAYEFQSTSQYLTDNLLNLVASHTVLDPSNNIVAQQTFRYDEPSYITPSYISTQHGTPISAEGGNLTTTTSWLNGGTSPQTHTNWYDTGETYQAVDARGNATTMQYSSAYAGSLPTSITNAKGQTSTFAYDFSLGVKTSFTDANTNPNPSGNTTTWNYDTLGRVTSIFRPEVFPGTSVHSQTTICYDDVAAYCTSTSPLDAVLVTETVDPTTSPVTNLQEEEQIDGFGRKTLTRLLSDPDGVTYTRTSYDNLGHVYQVWNPTRCVPTSSPCSGEGTWGITTHQYDAINRENLTIPPDGTSTTNNVAMTYTGNQTTVVDQMGISRTSTVDALGRLTQVSEDNMGWITMYQYDTLGNLLCAEQHGGVSGTGCSSSPSNDATSPWRVRRFTYDTLSRLLTATNAETGAISYTYDANGNVASKTDARGITINYSPSGSPIDALNRVTEKTYSNGESPVTYTYDDPSAANGIGRRTEMTDQSGQSWWEYDPGGKVARVEHVLGGNDDQMFLTYDLLGSTYQILAGWQNVQYQTGGAGRSVLVQDIGGPNVYAQNITYTPAGQLAGAKYGAVSGGFAGITVSNTYDSRLQPVMLQANTPASTVLSLGYNFGLGTNDNGDVQGIVNYKDSTRNQTFHYDGVSRLTSAQTGTWGTQFTYDPWGNMITTSGITGTSLPNPMPEPVDRIASPQNQLTSSLVNYVYSAGGEMTNDGSRSYTYDAEGQIGTAGGQTYTYDGDGQRVQKGSSPGSADTVLYWDGIMERDWNDDCLEGYVFLNGQRLARVDGCSPGGATYYYLQDHLGSSSVVTDASGTIQNESDFYPFGGENVITLNVANQKYKFTGKERDAETGNDYFGARYYSSTVGGFLSPDWAAKAEPIPYAKLNNPQSLNLYAYAQGNAETLADHDGHTIGLDQAYTSKGTANEVLSADGDQAIERLMAAVFYDQEKEQESGSSTNQTTAPPAPASPTPTATSNNAAHQDSTQKTESAAENEAQKHMNKYGGSGPANDGLVLRPVENSCGSGNHNCQYELYGAGSEGLHVFEHQTQQMGSLQVDTNEWVTPTGVGNDKAATGMFYDDIGGTNLDTYRFFTVSTDATYNPANQRVVPIEESGHLIGYEHMFSRGGDVYINGSTNISH